MRVLQTHVHRTRATERVEIRVTPEQRARWMRLLAEAKIHGLKAHQLFEMMLECAELKLATRRERLIG